MDDDWTKEFPTEDGCYWVALKNKSNDIIFNAMMVKIVDNQLFLSDMNGTKCFLIENPEQALWKKTNFTEPPKELFDKL